MSISKFIALAGRLTCDGQSRVENGPSLCSEPSIAGLSLTEHGGRHKSVVLHGNQRHLAVIKTERSQSTNHNFRRFHESTCEATFYALNDFQVNIMH